MTRQQEPDEGTGEETNLVGSLLLRSGVPPSPGSANSRSLAILPLAANRQAS